MAHYARIDENNIVTDVVVVSNEFDDTGADYLSSIGLDGTWIKTSYNTQGGQHLSGGEPLRMNFAGVGYTYNPELDAFIPPRPNEDHVLDLETCTWINTIPLPVDEEMLPNATS